MIQEIFKEVLGMEGVFREKRRKI